MLANTLLRAKSPYSTYNRLVGSERDPSKLRLRTYLNQVLSRQGAIYQLKSVHFPDSPTVGPRPRSRAASRTRARAACRRPACPRAVIEARRGGAPSAAARTVLPVPCALRIITRLSPRREPVNDRTAPNPRRRGCVVASTASSWWCSMALWSAAGGDMRSGAGPEPPTKSPAAALSTGFFRARPP